MKFTGKQPRLLPDVMQAIVDLKEGQGSTQNKILEHIQSVINTKKIIPRPRNVTMQIRRALKHGVQSGLLKQRAGKFILGIHPRDFALYKSLQQMGSLNSCCNKCKRGRKKRSRKRRKKRYFDGDFSDTDYSAKEYGTPEPVDAKAKAKKKKKKAKKRKKPKPKAKGKGKKKGKGKGKGRKRSSLNLSRESSNPDQINKSPETSKDAIRPQRSVRKFEENNSEAYGCDDAEKKPEENYIN